MYIKQDKLEEKKSGPKMLESLYSSNSQAKKEKRKKKKRPTENLYC